MIPKIREIWLVSFPFSDLTATKLRPALVVANHREETINLMQEVNLALKKSLNL